AATGLAGSVASARALVAARSDSLLSPPPSAPQPPRASPPTPNPRTAIINAARRMPNPKRTVSLPLRCRLGWLTRPPLEADAAGTPKGASQVPERIRAEHRVSSDVVSSTFPVIARPGRPLPIVVSCARVAGALTARDRRAERLSRRWGPEHGNEPDVTRKVGEMIELTLVMER